MSLDPNLALNPGRPAPLDMATPTMNAYKTNDLMLQPALTQANTDFIKAQTLGAEAKSEKEKRDVAAQSWFGDNASKFLVDNPAGGPPIYDASSAMKAATKAGYADLVPHIAKDYSEFMTAQTKTSTDVQNLNQVKFNASVTGPSVAAQLIKAVPDKSKAQMYQASKKHLQSLFGDTISEDMMPDLSDPKQIDEWSDATTSAASSYLDKIKAQNEVNAVGATVQGAETSRASQGQAAATQEVSASAAGNTSKILSEGASIDPSMDTLGKRRAAVAAYNKINGTDFSITSPGLSAMLMQESGRQSKLAEAYSSSATAGKPQQVTPPNMKVAPGTQQSRDADRLSILRQELISNPNDPALQAEIKRAEIKLGKEPTSFSPNAPKTVDVFNPKTGKMIQVAPEDVEAVKRFFSKSKTPKVGSAEANAIEAELGRGR